MELNYTSAERIGTECDHVNAVHSAKSSVKFHPWPIILPIMNEENNVMYGEGPSMLKLRVRSRSR